jgi:hypothetical protein
MMNENESVKPVRRVVVDDVLKKDRREKEKQIREKLQGKAVADLKQADLLDLVLLLARQAGLVDGQGKVV